MNYQNQSLYYQSLFYNINQRGHTMSDDSDNLTGLEPIRMLQLFPVRKIKCFEFDLEKYKKLFQALSCSFCQQIFNNPTYLRCSHRFCKECIEKHIRLNDKKSCPICRSELTTKRDSKSDLKLISLISYAFGDANSLQNEIDKINQQATKNIKFVKTKSGIQMQIKRDRPESMDNKSKAIQTASRKRLKNQNQDVDKIEQENKINLLEKEGLIKREISQSQKVVQWQLNSVNKNSSVVQINEHLGDSAAQLSQKRQNVKPLTTIKPETLTPIWGNTKQKGVKKKKAQIIQIYSEGSNQAEVSKRKQKSIESNLKQIIQAKKQIQQNVNKMEARNMQQQQQKQKQKPTKQQITEPERQNKNEQHFLKQYGIKDEIVQIRNKLKQHLGSSYMKNILMSMKSNKKCTLRLKLIPLPTSNFTPKLDKPQFQMSIYLNIQNVKQFLKGKFNLGVLMANGDDRLIEISLLDKQNQCRVIENASLTILDLIQQYWNDYKGISIFNIKNTLSKSSTLTPTPPTPLHSSLFKQGKSYIPTSPPCFKILYYKINLHTLTNNQ